MWKEAVRRGAARVHAGSAAAAGLKRDACGRIALERRTVDRGAERAMFLRPNIVMEIKDVGTNAGRTEV